jgi:hypothetical protein
MRQTKFFMSCRGVVNKSPPPKDDGMDLLMKYEMENIAVNVIAGLTGQAVENIQADLEDSDMQTLLETYAVGETLFRNAMEIKMLELVNEEVASGRITQSQAVLVIEKINAESDMARQ